VGCKTSGLIRSPALHFLALGGLLFVASAWWQHRSEALALATYREPLEITSGQVTQLRRDLFLQNGQPPSADQLAAAVDAAIDEEVLFRQALEIGLEKANPGVRERLIQIARFVADDPDQDEEALYRSALEHGFDRSDLVVRRQLAMQMRLIAADTPLAGETQPDRAELEAYLQAHAERFIEPWRARLTHVYVSDDRHGATAQSRALKLLDKLRSRNIGPQAGPDLGEPFLLGNHIGWRNRAQLEQSLGAGFADAVARLAPGSWSQPIQSIYGWHLVWIEEIQPPTVPNLDQVQDQVMAAIDGERREQRMLETLQSMRAGYDITVDWPQGNAVALKAGGNG
jgi:peptidyl-prolyl cis-trans isomerase C